LRIRAERAAQEAIAVTTPDSPPSGSPPDVDPQVLAERCATAMWERDRASRRLGISTPVVAPGRATLTMRVDDEMVNGQGNCHGGYLATLADSAFAFACNTYDNVTVAAGFDIDFVAPGRAGDQLVATAVERARVGRSGVYDVSITRENGELVAVFRGRSRSLGRPLLTSDPDRIGPSLP
jgi:acyl-CoA thioesterase